MDMRRTASVFMIWNAICVYVDSCTFPSVLEGKTWGDSDKGQPVTFSGSDMLGWNVSAFSTVMTQWECLFNQNDIIVSKSSFVFGLPFAPPVTYYVYICMWIVSLDSDKFIYYLLADFISDFNTRAYKDTKDNLGPCDVCKLSLSLVPADAKVMTSTGHFPQISQSYSPVTCDSVLQTTSLSSTTTTSNTSEEASTSESTSTVAVITSTDSSTTSTSRETQVSSTETTIGPTTTKATTVEFTIGSTTTESTIGSTTTETTIGSTTTETTIGSTTTAKTKGPTTTETTIGSTTTKATTMGSTTTESTIGSTTTETTKGSTTTETTLGSTTTETTIGSTTTEAITIGSTTTESTIGSTTIGSTTREATVWSTTVKTTTFGSTTTMLHTESSAEYAKTKLSTPKSTTPRLNIVPSTTGHTIDSEKMILPMMSNEAFITMVICGGLVVLVVAFITVIGMYSSLKSKQKPKNIRYRHNYHKYFTP